MAKETVEDVGTGTDEPEAAVTDRKPSSSLWPMFVAFGLAIAEVGVFLGVFVLTVVGFLTFTGAVAGILHESGYVDDAWRTLGVLGVLGLLTGTAVFGVYGGTMGGSELVAVPNAIAYRGLSLIAAGILTVLTAALGGSRQGMGPTAQT